MKGKVLSPFKTYHQFDKASSQPPFQKMSSDGPRRSILQKFEEKDDEDAFQNLLGLMKRLHCMAATEDEAVLISESEKIPA